MQELTMLSVSYATAGAAMFAAAVYLIFRLRLFVTTTTMLVGSLLLIYGPTFLTFSLSSGETAFLIQRLSGSVGAPNPLFPVMKSKVPDFNAVIIAMNFSVALMYLGIIAGIEAVDRFFPARTAAMRSAVANWNPQSLRDDLGDNRILLVVIVTLLVLVATYSLAEDHLGTISKFFSITHDENNAARNAFRLQFGGSPSYLYRLILSAVVPMFVIWGLLAGALNRSWPLLLAALLLLIATMVGKLETLSKAPPAFFVLQLMLAALLAFWNRITWRTALGAACAVALVFSLVTRLIMIFPEGTETLKVVYYRVFEVQTQALLEYFAAFPFLHPYMWGTNLRPIAMLVGQRYMPAFSLVNFIWYGSFDNTNPSLFIADAWADFSYAGVILFSVIAGAVCRSIDAILLVRGKTVVAVAVLGATFIGVLTLLTTALNIALVSGGLLLAPGLAGVLVLTTRYLGRRPSTPRAEHLVRNQ
jgi:oligosaccharide repeat unit polymerase